MRYVRFWLTAPYKSNELTAIRGQWGETGEEPELYEIYEKDGVWKCLRWLHLVTDPDAHAFKEIASTADCFSCMVAAENDAKQLAEASAEDSED